MTNVINWFEIPVADMTRAIRFYEHVFQINLEAVEAFGTLNAFFPGFDGTNTGGSLTQGEGYIPSMTGVVVYFNGNPDLGEPLARVVEAGGQVLLPKTSIGDSGYMALFADSEGNRIGLHSNG